MYLVLPVILQTIEAFQQTILAAGIKLFGCLAMGRQSGSQRLLCCIKVSFAINLSAITDSISAQLAPTVTGL